MVQQMPRGLIIIALLYPINVKVGASGAQKNNYERGRKEMRKWIN